MMVMPVMEVQQAHLYFRVAFQASRSQLDSIYQQDLSHTGKPQT
jgi:hypothetical protein